MKSLHKTIGGSLILTLAFFTGSFCLHPMAAQAMGDDADMNMAGQAMDGSEYSFQRNDISSTAWKLCVINCASETPQAVVAKQFSIDSGMGFLADTPDNQTLSFFEFSSGPTDFSGTHPPAPDILFSVFKKE